MRRPTLFLLVLLGCLSIGSGSLISTMNDLTAELTGLKRKVDTKVAFSTSLSVGRKTMCSGPENTEILIFKHVFINIGNGYNRHTGRFKAPVKGAYYFSMHTWAYNGRPMGAYLVKNGHVQVATWEFKSQTPDHAASNSVVLYLNPRDDVHIVRWGGTRVCNNGNRHTTFSGFLLIPL